MEIGNIVKETIRNENLSDDGDKSWKPVCCNDDDKFGLEDGNEGETNLFALSAELSWLGEKAEEVKRFLQSESHDVQEQPNSIICHEIVTSSSIFSQCHQSLSFPGGEEIVEMEEADILAEHTHLCSICGKEFRRDGNVRIHMRSHGEEYKSKKTLTSSKPKDQKSFYSCPFQGCTHNRRHPNFKHLKSMASLRNHYRRTHCARIYACNNCGKEFSFLGDLKTHGNKCGHSKWQCSCSLSFSTRNKLLRHLGLGCHGHKPVPPAPAVSALNGENSTGNDKPPG
ncbi:hypothetical protein SUGI_0195720 [Cryptomeria japonica]|uniref:protein SENSITIVE TO PROTON RHIZOTOXICITY 2-like n=1 Tax=Cryptomeria japonica TaxID=3369 RepID=UPI002408D507|nr:protein SENSITIVE TO PROTON RHIZOTOXICITY 2-like [Cryptomeria japonica]GLJ12682.1 hypothetical protein SUGI_0195720 [Cryptomeria japonica]